MLGTDDDQEPEEGSSGPDDGMDELAVAAAGDSVTADRLRGREKHFPDCRPALLEGQQPHHMILLTSGPRTFEATTDGSNVGTYFDASTGGVALLTGDSLLAVIDDYACEVPYANVQGCLRTHREIEVFGMGHAGYALYVARSADDAEVTAGFRFLRRKIREQA